jgi:hypothetical protein
MNGQQTEKDALDKIRMAVSVDLDKRKEISFRELYNNNRKDFDLLQRTPDKHKEFAKFLQDNILTLTVDEDRGTIQKANNHIDIKKDPRLLPAKLETYPPEGIRAD